MYVLKIFQTENYRNLLTVGRATASINVYGVFETALYDGFVKIFDY